MLLAEQINTQAQAHGFVVYAVDGTEPVEVLAERIEQHFAPFLAGAS